MYFIIEIMGCLPYLQLVLNHDGDALLFETKEEAEQWAKKNCAWDFQVYKWGLNPISD